MKMLIASFLTAGLFVMVGSSARADLVLDGGFELDSQGLGQPSFGDWAFAQGNSSTGSGVNESLISGGTAHTGSKWYSFQDAGPGFDSLSQTVSTTVGSGYLLTYWVALLGTSGPADEFRASWNGSTISGSDIKPTSGASFGYTKETFTVTASGATSTIAFQGINQNNYFELDDVSLIQTSSGPSVPEPSSLLLCGLGALGLTATLGWKRWPRKAQPIATPQSA